MRDKMRNAKEDLEFFETNRFKGSKVKDIVEHWIERALEAESVLNDIYPMIAGRVIQLKDAGEEKAMQQWNEVAQNIYAVIGGDNS